MKKRQGSVTGAAFRGAKSRPGDTVQLRSIARQPMSRRQNPPGQSIASTAR
jgi:hypothetical protein